MSRGFVKEGDQEDPPLIPPRAELPNGELNYVTPRGMEKLLAERRHLEEAYNQGEGSEVEKRRENTIIDGRLKLLNERIQTARVLNPSDQPEKEVRFGARVTFENISGPLKGKTMTLQIVGADEADLKEGMISFAAPLARAAMGKSPGEIFTLNLSGEKRKLKVVELDYGVS